MALSGNYKALNTLSASTQALINSGQSLVLVRETSTANRTTGTMWYKGQVLGFTVEDAIRTSKIKDKTCIPSGRFNLRLSDTGNPNLKEQLVNIPGLGLVMPRVGTDSSAIHLEGPGNLDFDGVRIHRGRSETSSAGCIIFSDTRNSDGTIGYALEYNKTLTRLIHNNNIRFIDVVHEFQGGSTTQAAGTGINTTNTPASDPGNPSIGPSISSTGGGSSFDPIVAQVASQTSLLLDLGGDDKFDIFKNQLSISNPQDQIKATIFDVGQQIYIPLEDLVKILNKYILVKDYKSKTPIVEISLTEGNHMENPGEPLLCLGNPFQLSTNPGVCLIKNEAWLDPAGNFGIGYDPGDNFKNTIKQLKKSYWYKNDFTNQAFGVIQNIYVNLGYIYGLITSKEMEDMDKKEKKDIYVFDFLKTMMNGINTAIGNVANFDVYIDPQDCKARIIDLNYVDTKSRPVAWEEAFELQMYNTKSVVRSYSFESKIFNDQTSTVVIGAQQNGGAMGTKTSTLVDFNQNLTDRIVPNRSAPPPVNPGNTEQQQREQLKYLGEGISTILLYILKTDINAFSWLEGDYNPKDSSKYANALKDIISYFSNILQDDNKNRAIIPTKLNIEMDGIGGIGIGNIFKVPLELLPKGYKGDGAGPAKIGYIVTGVNHSVKNSNWITNLESQFIILDPPKGLRKSILKEIQYTLLSNAFTEEPIALNTLITTLRTLQERQSAAAASTSISGGSEGNFVLGARTPEFGKLVNISTLNISEAGVQFILGNEGFFGKVYDDKRSQKDPYYYVDSYTSSTLKGKPTIGYGTLIDTAQERTQFEKYLKNTPNTMPKEEGMSLFKQEIDIMAKNWIPKIKKPISQNMYDALASMAYNTGPGNSNFLAAISLLNTGNYQGAAAKIAEGPITSGGTVLPGLVRRRKEESTLFLLNFTGT